MKCVCRRQCQIRMPAGKIRFFEEGAVEDFKECPSSFELIEGKDVKVDFGTAKKEELMESEFELKELRDFIYSKYKKKTGSTSKNTVVKLLLDCRYRDIGDVNAKPVVV